MGRGRTTLWRLRRRRRRGRPRASSSARSAPFVDPKPAEIPGLDDFEGKLIHSARWDHDYDLAGKRVAIVGTGASAVQIIPSIAREVGAARRLPAHADLGLAQVRPADSRAGSRRLFRARAVHRSASRARVASGDRRVPARLHGRQLPPRAVRRAPARARATGASLAKSVKDPELRRKLTPDYGMGCKRPSVSNRYLRTFNRDNVELVTDPIERVTRDGHPHRRRDASARSTRSCSRRASGWRPTRRTTAARRSAAATASTSPTHYEENRLQGVRGRSHARPAEPLHDLRPVRLDRRVLARARRRPRRATSSA